MLLILVALCWIKSQHGGHSSSVPYHKNVIMDVLVELGIQWSAIAAFNPLAAQRCALCRQGFSSSTCQAVVGIDLPSITKVYQKCWNEWLAGLLERVYQTMPFLPEIGWFFWLNYLGLDWLGAELVFIVLLFILFFNLIIIIRLQIILSSLN